MSPIPLARPSVGDEERALIDEVLGSGQLSRGPMVKRFEAAFAEFLGADHAVALSSGSAALHLGIKALRLPPSAEIITSPFSVPATANMVLAAGARLQLCDISPTHLGLDPPQVACTITDETAAVLPVHVFGQSAVIEALVDVCRIEGIQLIEDACEALGTRVGERALGTFGDMGCFGFYPNKQITTGEGGMLVTDNPELAERVRLMRNHGRSMDGPWHDQQLVGLNYRLPELSAALGLGQLQRIEDTMTRRAALAATYRKRLAEMPGLRPVAPDDSNICWFAWVVILDPDLPRDQIIADLKDRGIQAGRYFAPLHQQPALAPLVGDQGPFPVAEAMAARALALPFFNDMTTDQAEQVCEALATLIQRYR
ncbi:MAG: DegT/DnrJ/EryC1/StrS family aminotransferase [Pseudomonadota bacterium]